MKESAVGLLAAACFVTLPACTSFDDAVASQGYFDFAGATNLCARFASCEGLALSVRQSLGAPADGGNFSVCMSWLAGLSPTPPGGFANQIAALQAIADASSCNAALAGLAVSVSVSMPEQCAGSRRATCAGANLVDCANSRIIDCGSSLFGGATCEPVFDGLLGAVCQVGTCTILEVNAECVDTDTLSLCAATGVPKWKEQINCGALGEVCAGPAGLVCINQGDTATLCDFLTTDATVCSSDTAIVCEELGPGADGIAFGGTESHYACGDVGSTCVAAPSNSIAYCQPAAASCTPTDEDVNTCSGDQIIACVSGKRVTLDCTVGGGTCSGPPGQASCTLSF